MNIVPIAKKEPISSFFLFIDVGAVGADVVAEAGHIPVSKLSIEFGTFPWPLDRP